MQRVFLSKSEDAKCTNSVSNYNCKVIFAAFTIYSFFTIALSTAAATIRSTPLDRYPFVIRKSGMA